MTHQGDEGGSTNSITWLTAGLAARGHEVFLACRPESLIASRFRRGDVTLVPARLPRGLALFSEARRWERWIREHRIDVVNAHASLDRHLVSYLKFLGSSAALVHTRRNVALSTGGSLRARFDVASTHRIIAVSRRVADDLVRRGIPESHLSVIRNGIPLDALREPDPERVEGLRRELELRDSVPVIGVVARRKSQDDLLRAAKRLGRPLEIVMVGLEEDDELRRLASELPACVRSHVLGFRSDVTELFGLFDVFVLPSRIEGFSLALIEAMARGLPCLATDAGGNREALADSSGVLFPPEDPTAIANALAAILEDPDALRTYGARATERARREFDVSRTIERTEAVYASLLREEVA